MRDTNDTCGIEKGNNYNETKFFFHISMTFTMSGSNQNVIGFEPEESLFQLYSSDCVFNSNYNRKVHFGRRDKCNLSSFIHFKIKGNVYCILLTLCFIKVKLADSMGRPFTKLQRPKCIL